jgi:hypothetical protein
LAAGHAIGNYLNGKSDDPSGWFVRSYSRYRTKRLLRFLFDHFQSDLLFNLLLSTKRCVLRRTLFIFTIKEFSLPKPVMLAIEPMLRQWKTKPRGEPKRRGMMGLGNTIVDIACLGAVPGLTYRFLRF